MKLTILLTMTLLLFSCGKKQEETPADTETTAKIVTHCYGYTSNNDTVMFKPVISGNTVTGTLTYNLFEKDKNDGTIRGEMQDKLLIADYTFNSEGVVSTRQVVFRKIGDTFVEGTGEVLNENGKVVFKNIDSLNYENSIVLQKMDCQ